jgi:hypothetical protein
MRPCRMGPAGALIAACLVLGTPDLDVDPSRNRVYLMDLRGSLIVFDGNDSSTQVVPVGTFGRLRVNPATHRIYMAGFSFQTGERRLTVVSGDDLSFSSVPLAVDGNPVSLAVNAATDRVFVGGFRVGDFSSRGLVIVDGATLGFRSRPASAATARAVRPGRPALKALQGRKASPGPGCRRARC